MGSLCTRRKNMIGFMSRSFYPQGTHRAGEWVGLRAGLDTVKWEQFLSAENWTAFLRISVPLILTELSQLCYGIM